jgi:hypothetical protein
MMMKSAGKRNKVDGVISCRRSILLGDFPSNPNFIFASLHEWENFT